VEFGLEVANGKVVSGTIEQNGTASATTTAAGGSAAIRFLGSLSGAANLVVAKGTFTMKGMVTIPGAGTVPLDVSIPGGGTFSPSRATCRVVVGDLATGARAAQQAAGFSTTVDGDFVAVRKEGPVTEETRLVDQYVQVLTRILDLAADRPSAQQVVDLTVDIDELNAAIKAGIQCVGVPPAFQKGLADPVFGKAFRSLLQRVIDEPSDYAPEDLLRILASAIRAGAVGAAADDQAASQKLLTEYEATTIQKLNNLRNAALGAIKAKEPAFAADEIQRIWSIYVQAQQLGLSTLEKAAFDALEKLGEIKEV